ncbi:hypothetical protein CN198_19020 [Sinorhizobium meliloti]|uniref:hypothetical protein n=1 Tax=Rhizobium meliloti TaxID=382 RepID=UPI000FD87ACC|nr:hypothetical protein [Sinorhizobium meliloti]MDW9500279.1 hypothetical protein [Sinorhizobium meliloti]MDX0026904.1 hypothetical protein [Sinorhizobium meliloti]MDX0070394.1 hypothetical protein [Sinorhizobium meliloti]RVH66495.1 hypothetical protein CN198_19020 [Sinorhizobium meliloti]RVK64536.1 hypothetical protein CN159_23900 [Sinorhizobium meliloti]
MTGAEIMYAVGFFVGLFGAIFGVWKYVDGKIGAVRDELAAHKLHVAESYVTKAGMQEQTAQIMRAIEGVGSRIDAISERLDRVFEQRSSRRTSN